jgi:hypothetical protein
MFGDDSLRRTNAKGICDETGSAAMSTDKGVVETYQASELFEHLADNLVCESRILDATSFSDGSENSTARYPRCFEPVPHGVDWTCVGAASTLNRNLDTFGCPVSLARSQT